MNENREKEEECERPQDPQDETFTGAEFDEGKAFKYFKVAQHYVVKRFMIHDF